MRWVFLCGVLAGCAAGGRAVVTQMAAQPFCTRTLGMAQCFADPAALPDRPQTLVDTPVRTHVVCDAWWRVGCRFGH